MSSYLHSSHLPRHRTLDVAVVEGVRVDSVSRAVVHPHATVVFFERGEAVVWCGVRFAVQSGDVLAVPEGQPHYVESANNVRAWTLSFCPSCMTSPAGRALAEWCQRPLDGMGKLRTLDGAKSSLAFRHLEALEAETETSRRRARCGCEHRTRGRGGADAGDSGVVGATQTRQECPSLRLHR